MHRNTFINSPQLLDNDFSLRKDSRIYFAGQISGVEGYMESAASGILAGFNLAQKILGYEKLVLPEITMLGALTHYISDETVKNFQPMGAAFGIVTPLEEKIRDKKERYETLAKRSLDYFDTLDLR
jgi:methylenetetrahydrofolate--tRNA-(uracil-5-)-methyltransferase